MSDLEWIQSIPSEGITAIIIFGLAVLLISLVQMVRSASDRHEAARLELEKLAGQLKSAIAAVESRPDLGSTNAGNRPVKRLVKPARTPVPLHKLDPAAQKRRRHHPRKTA